MENLNNDLNYNNFSNQPLIPYKIIERLVKNNSQSANDLFKLLKYSDIDALDKPNLTTKEKKALIWKGQDLEQNFNIFMKPLIGSSLDDAEAQTQMRIYRYSTYPESKISSVISIQLIFITNEKASLVEKNGVLCERTDLMESEFLDVINGMDIGIGSGFVSFDREISRSSNSQLTVSNSRSLYGRIINLSLNYSNINSDCC